MQLLRYTNEQFAGSRDRVVSFAPGMNVILGDNEAGKSTMIEGIYATLLKQSRLDGRKDKEFIDKCFPTNGANCIDGTVQLLVSGQRITIKKEWDKGNADHRTALILAETGAKYTGTAAEAKIAELLDYGSAIYNYIIFGRQKNEEAVLEWIYSFMSEEAFSGTDEEKAGLKQRIAGAMSAAGGISEELFLQKLEEKLETLSAHWDFSLNAPEKNRGIGNPWGVRVGEILQAYYDRERKKLELSQAQMLLSEVIADEKRLEVLRGQKAELQEKQEALKHNRGAIEKRSVLAERRMELEHKLEQLEGVSRQWPMLLHEYAGLQALETEQRESKLRQRKELLGQQLETVWQLEDEILQRKRAVEGLQEVEKHYAEYNRIAAEERALQGTLSSAKLHVKIALKEGLGAVLTTADGVEVALDKELEEDINGFAKITLPRLGEILVSPQNLNVEELQDRIRELQNKKEQILTQYKVESVGELEQLSDRYCGYRLILQKLEPQLAGILSGRTAEAMKREYDEIAIDAGITVREDLDSVIRAVASRGNLGTISECLAMVRARLEGYQEEYSSEVELEAELTALRVKHAQILDELAAEGVPEMTEEEYNRQMREIETALYGRDHKSGINREIEDCIAQLGRLGVEADSIDVEGLEAEITELNRRFEQKKKLYAQYRRIREDYLELKAGQGDRYHAFYELLCENLSLVTGGRVRLTEGKLLQSGAQTLADRELLSKGTKQVVLLAFRLAVLEFYTGQDGGVLVLDDILLDMDPSRRMRAVELLQKFAERNQVIFTTCDPAVAALLGGSVIRLESGCT